MTVERLTLIRFLLLAEEDEALELRVGDLKLLIDQVIDLVLGHTVIGRVRDAGIHLGDRPFPTLRPKGPVEDEHAIGDTD